MKAEKTETAPGAEQTPVLALANYKVVGLEEGIADVYVPEVGRSYVLADITPDQFEMLHMLGWPHVKKTR